jgi:hypothetical protein
MSKLPGTRLFQDLKACAKKPSPALTQLYIEANRNAKTGLEGRFITACVQEDHYEQAVEVYMPHGAEHNEKLDKLYIYSESFTGSESHFMNDLFERKGKRTQETIDVNSEEQTDISEDSTLVLSAPQTVVPQEAPRTVLTQREYIGFSFLLFMCIFSAIFGRLGGLLLATVSLFTFIVIYWIRG